MILQTAIRACRGFAAFYASPRALTASARTPSLSLCPLQPLPISKCVFVILRAAIRACRGFAAFFASSRALAASARRARRTSSSSCEISLRDRRAACTRRGCRRGGDTVKGAPRAPETKTRSTGHQKCEGVLTREVGKASFGERHEAMQAECDARTEIQDGGGDGTRVICTANFRKRYEQGG
jgi:hypothetical protein